MAGSGTPSEPLYSPKANFVNRRTLIFSPSAPTAPLMRSPTLIASSLTNAWSSRQCSSYHLFSLPSTIRSATSGGLPAGTFARNSSRASSTTSLGTLAIEILRRHRRDVHRDIAGQVGELRVARDEVGLAVDFDEHADLAAGVDVAGDEAFVGRPLGLLRGLRRTALDQQRLGLLEVAGGLDERLAAIHHRRARFFAERFDLVGVGLI